MAQQGEPPPYFLGVVEADGWLLGGNMDIEIAQPSWDMFNMRFVLKTNTATPADIKKEPEPKPRLEDWVYRLTAVGCDVKVRSRDSKMDLPQIFVDNIPYPIPIVRCYTTDSKATLASLITAAGITDIPMDKLSAHFELVLVAPKVVQLHGSLD